MPDIEIASPEELRENPAQEDDGENEIQEELLGQPARTFGKKRAPQMADNLNSLEYELAKFAIDAELSQRLYRRLVSIVQDALDRMHRTREPVTIKASTLDNICEDMEQDGENQLNIPFKLHTVDLDLVADFPPGKKEEFEEKCGPVQFLYRNVVHLSEHIFGHPAFWEQTILNAAKVTRKGERIFTDVYSGYWWESMQRKITPGDVLLAIMFSSDQTVVSGDGRAKAWPLYLKLGTISTVDFGKPPAATVKLRTTEDMKSTYTETKVLIENGQQHSAKELTQLYSLNIVRNAFWDMPDFDIYASIVIDDLHQLGGVYKHLLSCVERLIRTEHKDVAIKEINRRAASLPVYRCLKHFSNGIFLSVLHNPTYRELKDNMTAALCIRHFIDFYHQATAKEHSEETLTQMEESLRYFNHLIPIFQSFSKNHMLWKYAADIRDKGCVNAYSTQQSEHQHRSDAKKPSRRTNRRGIASTMSQMGRYIEKRDILFDKFATVPYPYLGPTSCIKETEYKLQGVAKEKMLLDSLVREKETFRALNVLIRAYLDTNIEGRRATRRLSNMPSLDTSKDFDDDGVSLDDKIRADDSFHGQQRFDYAVFDLGDGQAFYGQVLLLFAAQYRKGTLYLCLARRFVVVDESHASGLRVLKPAVDHNFNGLFIEDVTKITRSVYIVPDFSSPMLATTQLYSRYLLNHDTDRYMWSTIEPWLPCLDDDQYIGWKEDTVTTQMETDNISDGNSSCDISDGNEEAVDRNSMATLL
ncbi:hypothetical protein EC973_000382 [Apophysomyces ossiformis]|uniref:Uncharacterized protein n=1 Tax=Apophysomyces ossiformis TaxID=679940 RepID=A0A8H7BQQ9_9FUNG|nr:hypothetical protein EC973_000382 [Apophysomyces ossiformis]